MARGMRKITKKVAAREAEILASFAENLRSMRRAAGLSQEELARAMDLSVSYVSMLERGQRNPPFSLAVRFADALNALPRALIG